MAKWTYLEVSLDPQTGRVTQIDGKDVTNPLMAPFARQVRYQLGNEGWELVNMQPHIWIFKREANNGQQWEYCCLAEDHAGGIRKGEWIQVYYRADGNHIEHEHRHLGTTLAQLGKNGWQMTGITNPGSNSIYDNTVFFFARPLIQRNEDEKE